MKNKGLAAVLLAVSIASAGQNVYAAELPYETPEEIAEEEYWDSLELLALCVEAEAGNQALEGKRLVAAVVLNRVEDPDWPDDITAVITQKHQFTSWENGAIERVWAAADSSYLAVKLELEHRSRKDIYYFTAGGYGRYGIPLFQCGDHYFSGK